MDNLMEIHSDCCHCEKISDENKILFSYKYTFVYELKPVTVKVCACMHSYNGRPHTEILEYAIRALMGDKCNFPNYGKIVYSIRESFRDRFEVGTILELVKSGGFSYNYYVKHDKDSDFVKKNKKLLIIVGQPDTYY